MTEEVFKVRFTQDGAKEIVRSFDDLVRGATSATEAAAVLTKATNDARRSADPTQKAYDKLAGSLHTLSRAEQAGIISAGERARLNERLTITAQAQLRPISTLISKIGEETRAWGKSNTERQATLRTLSQVEGLVKKGIAVSDQERSAIQAANKAYYDKRESLKETAKAEEGLTAATKKAAAEQATATAKMERENANLLSSYEQTFRNSGNEVESAMAKQAAALALVDEARRRGLVSSEAAAETEGRIRRQYEEAIDPTSRITRLTRERAQYVAGLANSGRNLAQVERELARLDVQGIVVSATRIRQLREEAQAVDRLQAGYEGIGRLKTLFSRVVGGVGLGMLTAGLTRSLDTITTLNNRLRLVASSQANANRLFDEAAKIAIETRSELSGVVEAYSRIARSTRTLGISQKDVSDITRAVTQSFKISGASIQEATATAIQFGQALASNRLSGDELRSVMEQGPRLTQAIVDGINLMNKTDPSALPKKLRDEIKKTGEVNIGMLRELAKQGLLTADVVAKAVLSQQQTLNDEFKKVIPTIGESFTVLENQWLIFLNDLDKGIPIASVIAGSIMLIGRNLQAIIPLALALGGMMATIFVYKTVKDFLDIFKAVPAWLGIATGATKVNTAATTVNTGAVGVQAQTVGVNTGALIAETNALNANSLAQGANAGARAAPVAGAGAKAVAAGGVGAATMAATGAAAAAATPRVSMLAKAGTALAGVITLIGMALKAALGFLLAFVAGTVAGLGVIIGLWSMLRDKTEDATEQLLIYGEGGTQKAIKGQIQFFDVVMGLWNTLLGKTDEITKSQMLLQEQVKNHGIEAAEEKTAAQIAAEQELMDKQAVNAAKTQSIYENMNKGIVKDFIGLVGDFMTGFALIGTSFVATMNIVGAIASNVFNAIGKQIANFYNDRILPILNAAKKVGIGPGGERMSLGGGEQIDIGSFAQTQYRGAEQAAAAFGIRQQERMARFTLSGAARREGAGRAMLDPGGDRALTNAEGDKNKRNKELDDARRKYRQLRDELNPLLKITEDYAEDQKTLSEARRLGIITLTQYIDLTGRLTRRYNDAIDPLSKYVRETNEELAILAMASEERELATAVLERERSERERLRRDITEDERARITEIESMKIAAKQRSEMVDGILEAGRAREIELGLIGKAPQLVEAESRARGYLDEHLKNNVAGAQELYEAAVQQELEFIKLRDTLARADEMYQSLSDSTEALIKDTAALNLLFAEGRIGLEQYNRELRNLAIANLAGQTGGGAGRERAILNLKNRTEDMAAGVEQAFNNAFQSIEDGFAGLFAGAQFDASQLFSNIASDAARIFYRAAIDPLITRLGQNMGLPGFADAGQAAAEAAATQQQVETAKTAVAMQGEQTRANLAALTTPTQIVEATATQTGIEGAKTTVATGGVAARTGLELAAAPAMISAAVATQAMMETAKTGATALGIAARSQIEGIAQSVKAGMAGADVATHAAAEGAKTGATIAGATARTSAEAAAASAATGFNLISTLQTVGMNAVKAATGAYAAIAGIPVVGPVLAPAAAAAALYGVYALGKQMFSAEGGFGKVPYDGAMTELHKEEMVLPAKYANPLRDNLTSGNGFGGDQPAPEVTVPVKVVNVYDPNDAVAAMDSAEGEQVILNVIRNNPTTVNSLLQGAS